MMKNVFFAPEVKNKLILIQYEICGVSNSEKNQEIWKAIEELGQVYRKQFPTFADSKPVLQVARTLYKNIGMEPSRYRPASEALLKRILQDKPLYQISALVDFGNFCSLKHLLPVGLYDLNKVRGDITVRIGKDEETYEGLGKPIVYLHDKLVLADEHGPFGNPSSDSKRTCVDQATSDLLFFYYLPKDASSEFLDMVTRSTLEDIHKFLSPEMINWKIVTGNE